MRKIGLDTNLIIGMLDEQDVWHTPTLALMTALKAKFPTKSIVWLSPDLPSLYDDIITLVQQSSGELNFNDALIALSCRNRNIPFLASFDADFDQVDWLKRLSVPADLPD